MKDKLLTKKEELHQAIKVASNKAAQCPKHRQTGCGQCQKYSSCELLARCKDLETQYTDVKREYEDLFRTDYKAAAKKRDECSSAKKIQCNACSNVATCILYKSVNEAWELLFLNVIH